jgi:hypothetical protein
MHRRDSAIGFTPQHIRQGATRLIGETSVQLGQVLNTVHPKTSEIQAQLAPPSKFARNRSSPTATQSAC